MNTSGCSDAAPSASMRFADARAREIRAAPLRLQLRGAASPAALLMKPSLQLRLSQHLALTPQLQQSIRLLQLSTLELNQEIEQAMADNPLLERDDDPQAGTLHLRSDGSIGQEATHASEAQTAMRRRPRTAAAAMARRKLRSSGAATRDVPMTTNPPPSTGPRPARACGSICGVSWHARRRAHVTARWSTC